MINKTYKNPTVLIIVVIMAVLVYGIMSMKDDRTATEKVGDAIHDLPQGVDKAEGQLEDRTPGQKLGDAIRDAGDNMKGNAEPSRGE